MVAMSVRLLMMMFGKEKEKEGVEEREGGFRGEGRGRSGRYIQEYEMEESEGSGICYQEAGSEDGFSETGDAASPPRALLRLSSSYSASAREQRYGIRRNSDMHAESTALSCRVGATTNGALVVAPRRRFISAPEIGALVLCLYGSAVLVSFAVKLVILPALVGVCAMRLGLVVRHAMQEMRQRNGEKKMREFQEKEKAQEADDAIRARERIVERARIEVGEREREERALEMHRQYYAENLLEAALQLLQKDRTMSTMHIDASRVRSPSLYSGGSSASSSSSSSSFQVAASSPHRQSTPMFRTAAEAAASTSTRTFSSRASPAASTLSLPFAQQQHQHGAFGHDLFFPRVASHSPQPIARVNNPLTLVR